MPLELKPRFVFENRSTVTMAVNRVFLLMPLFFACQLWIGPIKL